MKLDTVICIGAGPAQIPYIKEVKERGYHLICADRNPDSPGFELADDHVVSSTYDYNDTPRLILDKAKGRVKGVIAPCTGPPFQTANEVRRLIGLPYYNDRTMEILMDKLHFREYANSMGYSDIKLFSGESYPSFVRKPRRGGMGSQGVNIIAPSSDFVYEELIDGREITADAIWDGNSIVFLCDGWVLFNPELNAMVGHTFQEDPVLQRLTPLIRGMLSEFCLSLKLGAEFLNVDVIWGSPDRLHLIEVEFVPSDADNLLAEECFGYDFVKNFVSTYLGDEIQPQPKMKKSAAFVYQGNIMSAADGEPLIASIKDRFPEISLRRFDDG